MGHVESFLGALSEEAHAALAGVPDLELILIARLERPRAEIVRRLGALAAAT